MNCRRLRFGMPAITLAGCLLPQLIFGDPPPNAWQTETTGAGTSIGGDPLQVHDV